MPASPTGSPGSPTKWGGRSGCATTWTGCPGCMSSPRSCCSWLGPGCRTSGSGSSLWSPAPRRVRCHRRGRLGSGKGKPESGSIPFPEPFGWLLKLGAWRVAPYKQDLEALLADPGMQELLRNAPQTGRILRPLCRMLALTPDPALLPPPPKRVRRTAPSAPEPDPAAPIPEKPMRKRPLRTEARTRKPKWTYPGTEWRKWGGFWFPEPIRKPT